MKDALDVVIEVGCTVRAYTSSLSCWHGKGRVVEVDEPRNRVKLAGDAKEKYDRHSGEWRSVPMRDRWVAGGRHLVVSKGTV